MSMIDFHSHILPGIDDGSDSLEMTEQMLKMCEAQGILTVAATPHFYPDRMTLERFLEKRDMACDRIAALAAAHKIRLLPGAEAAFFTGMGKAEGMARLTIGATSLLLVEMPFRQWRDSDLLEIERLTARGLKPIIAHIERFYPYQKDRRVLEKVYSLPVLVQVNAEALLSWKTRRLALKLFREGKAQLLASDCHNVSVRPPNLAAAREVLGKKLGQEWLERVEWMGREELE